MRLNKFNDFKINENLDKDALEEILRGWGVFNPPLFFNWLEEHGYTIIELDPVGQGIVESFNAFESVEWYDTEDDNLSEFLSENEIDESILDRMYNQLGYVIINEKIDMREFFRKKFSPTMWERISKLVNIMMDAEYNGLRAIIEGRQGNDKEQYDHIMEYVYLNIKMIKGIRKLEKKTNKLRDEKKITDGDVNEFESFVTKAINEIHYRYPWKFKGFLADFDQDDMNIMVDEYNKLVKEYTGKLIPVKKDK